MSFTAITLYIASQQVFIVVSIYFVMTQSGNFWIYPWKQNVNIMKEYMSRQHFEAKVAFLVQSLRVQQNICFSKMF
jgi:hypothetical protein